ncbi:hypothetical protein [Paludisphaera soli]|uniref:hypothetical protein n=1 Tax=Paludisphaera soli TaxID=2712865 RepID=UPI0013EB028B|nr:hypothetical protein [Paludisphaera soli]
MPFDPSPVALLPPYESGGNLVIRWTSTAPAGTWHQVYVDRRLARWTRDTRVEVPAPTSKVRIDVGAVLPSEKSDDLSGSLAGSPDDRAVLNWFGGTYLDPSGADDVAGFRVYGEPSPGAGIDYGTPIGDLVAYPSGVPTDGWGRGRWGRGGWGRSSASYAWSSRPLSSGTWAFAVRSYDAAGNEGPPLTTSVAIAAPPPPPPIEPSRRSRMWYDYDPDTGIATLRWLAVVE